MDQKYSAHRNPSSPGKRRVVETDSGRIRLIPRGMPDSEDEDEQKEVIKTQPFPPAAMDHNVLNLTTSRKRKTLQPHTGDKTVLILPSPTTQIVHQIDSIRLAGTPVGGYTQLPMLGKELIDSSTGTKQSDVLSLPVPTSSSTGVLHSSVSYTVSEDEVKKMVDTQQCDHSTVQIGGHISPASPTIVPSVGNNIEITDETVLMEEYLQRPQHALNMKRMVSDNDEEEEVDENNKDRNSTGQKYPKHHQDHNLRDMPVIHVSTIVKPTSPSSSSSSSSSSRRKKHGSRHSTPDSKLSPSPTPDHTVTPTITYQPLPGYLQVPLTLVPHSSSLNVSLSSPTTTSPKSTSTSPQNQSKVNSFSISHLLAPDGPSKPTVSAPMLPSVHPSLLMFQAYYQQWYAQQVMASMRKFHGEVAEPDRTSVNYSSTIQTEPHVNKSHSPSPSPTPSPIPSSSHYSPHASPKKDTPVNRQRVDNGDKEDIENEPSLGYHSMNAGQGQGNKSEERGSDQRQNALLQVSEAHLAILPDEDGDTPLHLSIIQENIPLTFYLVRLIAGVKLNLDIANNLRQIPLHLAVITRQPMIAHLLVQNGASVNYPDRRGNTSIHLAAHRKSVNLLQILSHATNPLPEFNARNFAGLTPVHVATREGSVDVLKYLFQMGANKNVADSCSGRTPLHYAVEAENFQLCNFLLENNCNVNATTFAGNTPLHIAAGRRLKEIVALLMAYGANPAIANGEGDFPSDLPASLLMQRAKMNSH